MAIEDCENCKQLAEMYVKDTEELRAEILKLRKQVEDLTKSNVEAKRQLRHI